MLDPPKKSIVYHWTKNNIMFCSSEESIDKIKQVIKSLGLKPQDITHTFKHRRERHTTEPQHSKIKT